MSKRLIDIQESNNLSPEYQKELNEEEKYGEIIEISSFKSAKSSRLGSSVSGDSDNDKFFKNFEKKVKKYDVISKV